MKYTKSVWALALVTAAALVVAGGAKGDTLTSSAGTTPTLKATSTNLTFHNAVGTHTCNSSLEANVTEHGAGKPITATITSLVFAPCEGASVHNPTIVPGTLSFHATGTNHATLSSTGANYTTTMFGVECGYSTNATNIGTVTGGEHAVLNISAILTRSHGSFFCGHSGNWTGSFTFNSPTDVHLHDN